MNNDINTVMLEALLYVMEGESPSKAIENQERRGQQMVVRNCRLPKKNNEMSVPEEYVQNTIERYKKDNNL